MGRHLCSKTCRLNIVKINTTQNNLQIHTVPTKIPMTVFFFPEIENCILQFIWDPKGP